MDLKLVVLAWACLTTVAEGAAIDETALLDKRSNSDDLAASPLVSVLIQMIQRVEDDLEDVETDLNDSKYNWECCYDLRLSVLRFILYDLVATRISFSCPLGLCHLFVLSKLHVAL